MNGRAQRASFAFGSWYSLEGASSPGLCLPSGQSSCFVSPHQPTQLMCLRTLPWGTHTHLSQDGSQSEGFWEEQDSLWPGIILWLLTPRSLSAAHVCSPLSFTQTGFCLLCPCQDYSLEVFTRDKDWLFTCFCCYFNFQAQMGLVVYFSTGTYLCCLRKWKEEAGWLWISNLEPIYLLPHWFLQ